MAFPRSLTRPFAVVAVASFAGCALAYLFGPTDQWHRAVIADICWTWSSGLAVLCCALAARRTEGDEQRMWRWICAGCASFLAGQLVWDYYELWLRVRPPYPSLADVGFLGLYPPSVLAVRVRMRHRQAALLDAQTALDAGLVTFTAVALAYVFLFAPILRAGGPVLPVLTSIVWAGGGVAVLWSVLRQLIRRRGFSLDTPGLVTLALIVLSVTNVAYASPALSGTYAAGGILDLGWDVGLLFIAVAAAIARESAGDTHTLAPGIPSDTARALAVLVAVAGIVSLAVAGAWRPELYGAVAVWVAAGVAIIGVRFFYALRADRRYAELLEREVAGQTRSLMDSLAATANAERNVRLVMEAVPDAIIVLDPEGRTLDMNSAARALLSDESAATDSSLFDWLDPNAVVTMRENLEAALRGEVRSFEVPSRRRGGGRGTSSVLYAPVWEDTRVSRVLALVRDVTDQRRTEAQLQQAEKLAAIGQLVSGVAHEINNPAAIISGFAQTMLLDDLKAEHRDMAKTIHDEATRIGRITQNLLAFARAGGKERALIDLNDIIRRTFALRSYHLSTLNIAVTLDLDASDPKIWANASEVQQLLLNIVINAEQALVSVDPPRAITIRSIAGEHEVRLEIADNGPGIPPEIRGRIFDPFFTTKPEGVGTGLGLSICYGIARDHGGRIALESDPGPGARFVIDLPRDPRNTPRPPSDTRLPSGTPARRVSVLLVDDEASLRTALLQFLTRRGLDATAVGDGAEALRVLKVRPFDVIVSDVRMPGMGGRDFMEQLRAERPDLVPRVIFTTGDAFEQETATLLAESGAPTVSKPFDFSTLERLIRDVALRTKIA